MARTAPVGSAWCGERFAALGRELRDSLFCRCIGDARAGGLDPSLTFALQFLLLSPCVHSKCDVRIGARLFKTWTGKALVKL
jgi:hypothetical protein